MKPFFFLGVAVALLAVGACSSKSTPENTPGPDSGSSGGPDSGDVTSIPGDGDGGSEGGSTETDSGNPPLPPLKVDVTEESFTFENAATKYILAKPKNYDAARPYPLVLVLHGAGEDYVAMRNLYMFETYSGEDAIVAYPQGTRPGAWNQASLNIDDNPDMRFLRDLVAELKRAYTIDEQRVFGAGYSSGAFMVNFVACKIPIFKAIASNAGGAPYTSDGSEPNCVSHPIGALITHGALDPGLANGGVDVSSSEWAALFWTIQNGGCKEDDKIWDGPTTPSEPDPEFCNSYACSAQPVTLCIVPGVVHNPPWAKSAEVAWEFFKKFL